MGGKAAILLVLGFSLVFLVAGTNFNSVATRSVENVTDYFTQSNAYNIATSAANLAASKIFFDQTWTAGFNNVSFSGGTMSATVTVLDAYQNIRKVTATGTYLNLSKTVEVTVQPSKFSQFAYYSAYEPSDIWWTSSDTVWGPMHVQGTLKVSGSPVFFGKVTTQNGLTMNDPGHWEQKVIGKRCTKYDRRGKCSRYENIYENVWVPGADDPKFYGGYETGVNLTMPVNGVSNLEASAIAGGKEIAGHDTVYIKFQADSIKYKYNYSSKYTAAFASTFAPNGVIFAQNAVLRLEGTVKGQYTIGVSGSTSSQGKVFLDNDILYNSNPKTNPSSTDLLGIVAQNDIMVTQNAANSSSIDIYASMYSQQGGFGAENYSTRPSSGFINLYGGISQSTRRAVGTFNQYGTATGFSKRYRYDERLRMASPPFYPGTGSFQIVSWYE